MNVILILIDSCNRHYLSPYGCKTVRTPKIQELADRGVTFTNHCIGSAPCMPARRELMTGCREFLYRGWGALEPFDQPMSRQLRNADVVTQIITDHYHYWENSAHGYIEGFNGAELIRGQENDYWITARQTNEPDWVKAIDKYRPGWGSRYYRNVAHFRKEEDWFSPTVFRKAAEWLDANHDQEQFFLHIEGFDPHEPFHVPEPYRSMYTDDLNPDYTCWPPYQREDQRKHFFDNTSMKELAYIRAQYQGSLTMADNAIGQVWAAMDRHKLWDNTMVILTTDHGHELADAVRSLDEMDEHARDHTQRIPYGKQHPHYLSHANIPLIVWHPRMMNGGKQIDAMTNTPDLYATVLDAMGAEIPEQTTSRSILPLLAGGKGTRDMIYWGDFGNGVCCMDDEYVLLQGYDNQSTPLYWYSALMDKGVSPDAEAGRFIKGLDCPVWRIPQHRNKGVFPSILHRRSDPLFDEVNIIDKEPEVAASMRRRVRDLICEEGCPPEQLDRMGL